MVYSALVSLENTIDQILDHNRFSVSPHAKKLIISLDKCVISFQAFLEDFPEKAKKLEVRIRDVAAEAEDIIKWFLLEQSRYYFRYIEWIAMLRGILFEYQLQKVTNKLDSIATEVVEIKYIVLVEDKQLDDSIGASSSSQTDTEEIDVVGFNEDLIEIKSGLCGWEPQLQVLPIFGMGGIGKTTLARNAYEDQLIVEHFQIRVWVTISQDYIKQKQRILLDLLDSMKEFDSMEETSQQYNSEKQERSELGDECNDGAERSRHGNESLKIIPELSNSVLEEKVHKILTWRRFLIVMDDIWSTKVLDDLKKLFPNDNNGSRIMLTTRLTEVATYANSSILSHEMRLMDAEKSWNLLSKKVFLCQDSIPRELVSIGREIARSCRGLPLAIVVIAGVLSTTSKTLASWEEVAKNINNIISCPSRWADRKDSIFKLQPFTSPFEAMFLIHGRISRRSQYQSHTPYQVMDS